MNDIYKGAQEGLIWYPILFNVFINDILFLVKECTLYNYTDDDSLSKSDESLDVHVVIHDLQEDSKSTREISGNVCWKESVW